MALKIYLSPSSQEHNEYAVGNTVEQRQCNRIAEAAKVALERNGYTVKKAPEGQSYQKNVQESNAWGADIHMPIHTNAGGYSKGTLTLCYSGNTNDKYVKNVYEAVAALTPWADKGISVRSDLYEINNTKATCVYMEMAFHDKTDSAQWIIDNVVPLGEAIAKGMCAADGKTYIGNGSDDPDGALVSGGTTQVQKDQGGAITYQVHARKLGWMNWRCDGDMAGTTGQNRRIEAIRIQPDGDMSVSVHMKSDGDNKYSNITADTIIGTIGEKKRLESIMIEGEKQFRYRVHQKSYGWSGWASNGMWAGIKGEGKQIEAIQIKEPILLIRAHVQGEGWTEYIGDDEVIGTTGKSKRLEALQINPLGKEIKAKAHIQGDGWIDYGVIDNDTIIGTTGEAKRLECLCFEGEFEWRAHLAKSGWTDWTEADGVATLGTVGQALQMEAIEIRHK